MTSQTYTRAAIDGLLAGITKASIGLGNVDNTADATKPVSAAQQTAIIAAVASCVAGAPGALDTLNELAAALGNDQNFAATVTAALADRPTAAALAATYLPKWQASTAYAQGSLVVAPSGSFVIAKTNHTSGTSYAAANWMRPEDTIFAPRRLPTDPAQAGYGGVGFSSGPAQAIGVGAGGAVYMIQGTTMRRTTDLGVTTPGVGVPASTTASTCLQVIEWNGYVYGIFQDTSDSQYKLYRAPITTGSTALTWSASLLTFTPGTTSFGCTLTGTSTALLVGEYGDPVITATKTAHVWRSTDGTTFTATKTYGSAVRHVHCVAADPFNDGTVWASFGDNVANCYSVSTDHGATWTEITCNAGWQGVQISFDANWVYVAPDATAPGASLFVIDRATRTPRLGAVGSHTNLRIGDEGSYKHGVTTSASTTLTCGLPDFVGVFTAADKGRKIIGPGIPDGTTISAVVSSGNITLSQAATATATGVNFTVERNERPKAIAFVGAVDPSTGIYYGVTNNDPSGAAATTFSRLVLFIVPYVGGPVVRLGEVQVYGTTVLFDSNTNFWYGHVYRSRIQAPPV